MRKLMLSIAFLAMTMHAQNVAAKEQTVTLHVAGMTCGTCPIAIRHRALQLPGVHAAAVDLDSATATVTYEDSRQTPEALAAAITELGYPSTIEEAKP